MMHKTLQEGQEETIHAIPLHTAEEGQWLCTAGMDYVTAIWTEAQASQAAHTKPDISANSQGNQREQVLLLSVLDYPNS